MAAPSLFDAVAEALQARTSLDALAARGTLRLALKSAGLDPRSLTAEQMRVVLARVLPGELETRGVEGAQGVCEGLGAVVAEAEAQGAGARADSPEEVFRRMRERIAS